ncbi:DUF664 domain-containing protein, partial [Geobacillus sp. MMMUD3]|nr:DUF664 domain-containing protein [Geobacillus sp. MMMUD3]
GVEDTASGDDERGPGLADRCDRPLERTGLRQGPAQVPVAFGEELGLLGSFEGATLPDLTLAEVLAAFDRAVAEITATRTQAAADGIDLDAKVPVNNPWMPKDFDMSVRWILAHLNTEIARHAGHADIIRESIDGAVSYQLNAQAEG